MFYEATMPDSYGSREEVENTESSSFFTGRKETQRDFLGTFAGTFFHFWKKVCSLSKSVLEVLFAENHRKLQTKEGL
jgi:hypothetical protein